MAWAYTIFENIKIFHSNELMSQFYAVLMGKVSWGLFPLGRLRGVFVPSIDQLCPHHSQEEQVNNASLLTAE